MAYEQLMPFYPKDMGKQKGSSSGIPKSDSFGKELAQKMNPKASTVDYFARK